MIARAISILKDELATYVFQNKRSDDTNFTPSSTILENISNIDIDDNTLNLDNTLVISLVNIQEEGTLKNMPKYRQNPMTGGYEYDRPPAYINLFLLISSSPGTNTSDYEFAIDRLSLVVEFFQAKNYFTIENSPHTEVAQLVNTAPPTGLMGTPEGLRLQKIKMYVDLFSLTFEQQNHLWGSLGGKQVPAALYKVRLVSVQRKAETEAPVVERVNANSSPNIAR